VSGRRSKKGKKGKRDKKRPVGDEPAPKQRQGPHRPHATYSTYKGERLKTVTTMVQKQPGRWARPQKRVQRKKTWKENANKTKRHKNFSTKHKLPVTSTQLRKTERSHTNTETLQKYPHQPGVVKKNGQLNNGPGGKKRKREGGGKNWGVTMGDPVPPVEGGTNETEPGTTK